MRAGPTYDHAATVPTLEPGVTLLHGGGEALHHIVAATLSEVPGAEAFWIDGGNVVTTYALYDLVPSPRPLAGLRIARAFTAYQHHSLVRELVRQVSPRTELVVAPAFAELYRDDDVPSYERRELCESGLSICAALAVALSVPVLITDQGTDELSALATEYADAEIACEPTDLGLAFRGAGFETLGYWGWGFWQTTIPYWVELFGVADPEEPVLPAEPAMPLAVEG